MISAYSLVIVIGWVGQVDVCCWRGHRRQCDRRRHPHPPGERPAGGGLGGEPDVVVGVFPLEVGELVLAVLEVARVVLGVVGRRQLGR